MIDLHTHTTASDGTDSPAELITRAAAVGVRVLAITDHDTTAGWQAAAAAVTTLSRSFTLVPGTEFSCAFAPRPAGLDEGDPAPGWHAASSGQRPLSVHLLGYLYDPDYPALKAQRLRLREGRRGRGEAIVANLERAGYPISWAQVARIAGDGAVGRPHIGQALVESGVVADVSVAFEDLLSSASPHYVAKQDLPLVEGIGLIRAAGGVPVIAHPWARSRGPVLTEEQLRGLVAAGLLGLEADHPDHNPADRRRLHELADETGILATGSSDYHGTNKRTPLAADTTAPLVLERLLSLGSGRSPIVHSRS